MKHAGARLALIALCLLVFNSTALGASAGDFIAGGDDIWPQRADIPTAEKGADFYRQALGVEPDNFEAHWKLARNLCWIAEHKKDEAREKVAAEAIKHSKKAIELKPNDPAGHFFLGLSYGYYGEAKGVMKTMFLAKPIEETFRKVLDLEPEYQCGGAYVALGRGYYFLPGYRGQAEDYYKKAMEICPHVFAAHLFLAELYIKDGKKEEAQALVDRIVQGPSAKGWEPEYEEWKGEAEYYQAKINEME